MYSHAQNYERYHKKKTVFQCRGNFLVKISLIDENISNTIVSSEYVESSNNINQTNKKYCYS